MNSVEVCYALEKSTKTMSLDEPISDEEDSTRKEFVEDKESLSPKRYSTNEFLKDKIKNALNELSEREENVLKLRFGLEEGRNHTLEEVGNKLGVTRERVRQIEKKAIKKLQNPIRTKNLVDFLDA